MTIAWRNGKSPKDPIRALLLSQTRAASAKALETDGQITAVELERLQNLARLVAVHESLQPPPARKRWPLAALLMTTLVIISFLLFARVSETEIELELVVSEVSFLVPEHQAMTEVLDLSALGASLLREVRIPRARDRGPRRLTGESDLAVRLSVASDGAREGQISLAPLLLEAGTRVGIRHSGVAHEFRVSVEGSSRALRVAVDGPVHIAGDPELHLFDSPRSVILLPGPGVTDIDLTLEGKVAFAPQLGVSGLSFFRIDEHSELDRTMLRSVSTILSGNLYLEELNAKEHRLRPREALHFEDIRGSIHRLQLERGQMTLIFHGRARGMETGSGRIRTSLMPTYLEWLEARHGLSLLWGSTLYLFGLAAGLLRWWGIRI